jgi:hypothetical protein
MKIAEEFSPGTEACAKRISQLLLFHEHLSHALSQGVAELF